PAPEISVARVGTVSATTVARATARILACFMSLFSQRPERAKHEVPRGVFRARRAALDLVVHVRGPSSEIRRASPLTHEKNSVNVSRMFHRCFTDVSRAGAIDF